MDTETIDRLFLELSQFTGATTAKELRLAKALDSANSLCRSASDIAKRRGKQTNWEAFEKKLDASLLVQHMAMYPDHHAKP